MDIITQHRTKIDKLEQHVRVEDKGPSRITSNFEVHKLINALALELEVDMQPEIAYKVYKNAQHLRHDNWCSLLSLCCKVEGYKIGDVSFASFLSDNNIDISISTSNEYLLPRTPDILTFNNNKSYIFLGDVTVSTSAHAANARKYEKYKPIMNILTDAGYTVRSVNFAIQDDLSNIDGCVRNLVTQDFIELKDGMLPLFKFYSNSCNDIMQQAHDLCINKLKFQQILDKNDISDEPTQLLPKLPFKLNEEDVIGYEPIRQEIDLINMVKNEVEKYDVDEYFTSDITPSINAINKLIDNNSDKPHTEPKSSLKFVDNSTYKEELSDLDLISDYVMDITMSDTDNVRDYLQYILPFKGQIDLMKEIKYSKMKAQEVKNEKKYTESLVWGSYQYTMRTENTNMIIENLKINLLKGKKIANEKKEPKVIELSNIDEYFGFVENAIEYYGSISNKPPILPDVWESRTRFEMENTCDEREAFNYVKSTCGAQLCNSISKLYERIVHLSTNLSKKDNIFIPPNGSFIAIIPSAHAPITSSNVDLPFIFITRSDKSTILKHIEYEYTLETKNYYYYVSKLCRINLSKLSNWSNAGYKLVTTATYLLSKSRSLQPIRHKLVGILTIFILDIHQKVSEFLDLLKYIAFMPFSDISRLPELIKDKFDLLIKTKVDAWMLKKLKNFILELSKVEKLNAVKPKIRTFNSSIVPDSLGINMTLPSFTDERIRHDNVENFIEEVNMMNTVRPKHLYGSQFMDKSITETCEWNLEFEKECKEYGSWLTKGHDDTDYPFKSKFAYSSDAIHYAEKYLQSQYCIQRNQVENWLAKGVYNGYMHENCTLRGCTKAISRRANSTDIHTTSLEECLNVYNELKYDENECKVANFAFRHFASNEVQQYSMSEKDQRGGGRPIATPTLGAKAALMMIEKPEAAKGNFMANNIIVSGKNKLKEQCETYKKAISAGTRRQMKYIYQITEDQSKYSENDNPRKYEAYIRTNTTISAELKSVQIKALRGLIGREHLIKRMPTMVELNPELRKYIVREEHSLGVKAQIGWPQGMLNFISTNVHCAADLWITYAYNIAYPNNKVVTMGLVHSDDSWVTVCCNDIKDFKKFTLFRLMAKKLFCLKLNEKKLWASKYLGELVSNYNLNGSVHLSVGKTLANSFCNLTYQNWPIDVNNQISSLQQCYRNGATVGILILLYTVLKAQLISSYNVKGKQLELLHRLPVELGGFPNNSAYELAVCGVGCHYKSLLDMLCREKLDIKDNLVGHIIQQCIDWSMIRSIDLLELESNPRNIGQVELLNKFKSDAEDKWGEDDYENLSIPSRGDIFKCVRHIMPKSIKIAKTLKVLKDLPFEDNGLGMIITRPLSIQESLGHLKARSSSILFELASNKYTQSIRRLAISQSIQASSKVIRVSNYPAMTFNEFYEFMDSFDDRKDLNISVIRTAFSDDNDLIDCTYNIVHNSVQVLVNDTKRKVLSRMPYVDDKFYTIGKMQEVLLKVIDENKGTKLLHKYVIPTVSTETLEEDAERIQRSFLTYFQYHEVEYACSLIMQQFLNSIKSKLWTQPNLRNDTILTFLEDLYGKTIHHTNTYSIHSNMSNVYLSSHNHDLINSIYSLEVLNRIYPGHFKILRINDGTVTEVLNTIDITKLSENDRIKYALCQYLINNNRDHLDHIHTTNDYNQYYYIKQKYDKNRGYYGRFDVICRYKQAIVRISGSPGDLTLVSKTNDILPILQLMKIFTTRNFPAYKYIQETGWVSRTELWNTRYQKTSHWLTSYSSFDTIISTKRGAYAIGIQIEPDLSYPVPVIRAKPDDYTTDEYLRVISCIKGYDKVRISNIRQDISVPLRNKIELLPLPIQNFDNQMLLMTGAIENIILNKPHQISNKIICSLLTGPFSPMNSKNIALVFINFMAKWLKEEMVIPEDPEYKVEEIILGDLEGVTYKGIIELEEQTQPDDLEAVEIDYVEIEGERTGSLFKVTSLIKHLCMAFTGQVVDSKKYYFIKKLIYNENIIEWGNELLNGNKGVDGCMTLQDIKDDLCNFCPDVLPIGLYSFIITANLHDPTFWNDLSLSSIAKYDYTHESKQFMESLVSDFVKIISDAFFEGVLRERKNLLSLQED